MKVSHFNRGPNEYRIGANENYFLLFDEYERKWFTMDDFKDQPVPSFGSSPVPFGELKQEKLSFFIIVHSYIISHIEYVLEI